MAAVRKRYLEMLSPFLEGDRPTPGKNGMEWNMHCPLHGDRKRSASLNIDTGEWYCHGCGEGGSVRGLISLREDWQLPNGNGNAHLNGNGNGNGALTPGENITEAKVKGWVKALQNNEAALEELKSVRGLDDEIIAAYEIGWDQAQGVYTIPVRDPEGRFWNVRRYNMHPADDRRKIWGVKNMNEPRLYPIGVLTDEDPEEIIICEGEWDALLTIQHGFLAVTRTASATTWDAGWGELFADKRVYVVHDRDEAGQSGARKVVAALRHVADVRVVELPYELEKKGGKDLTDYWLDGHTPEEFRELLDGTISSDKAEALTELDPTDATVLETFAAEKVGTPLRVTVTIKGKRDPGYSVPRAARLTCTQDAGAKCQHCPLNAAGGDAKYEIKPQDPLVLELIDSTRQQAHDIIRQGYGAVKCNRLTIDVEDHQSVEILYARPSVDHVNGSGDEYKNMKITSVGRHDTLANNTVKVIGALHPDPRSHMNEFLAWDVSKLKTSLDDFNMTDRAVEIMKKFRPRQGQTPLDRLRDISNDLSAHVTRIYGRTEMHMAMDLVFHSALGFTFGGQKIDRGWLELLVVGDTRTGKSEAASGLVRHYRAGEVVSCESASFAGIVGGLQQYGGGKEWAISWGAIPLNDRRLVVLDEISGLSSDEIASMSDVRSRGVAQLTKIQTDATPARTRLIWTGNPRDGRMSDYTYGVQAIRPLIGNPEDVARFDLAMSASAGEVSPDEINRNHKAGRQKFGTQACNLLIRWAWSRTPGQITWAPGAEDAVFDAANALGATYVEDPPLVQAANARIKIARLAVAFALRLFSTDASYENVVVRKSHVKAAVDFLNRIYSMPGFGYWELSKEIIGDRQTAFAKRDDVKRWLHGRRGLAKFLRTNSTFRRQDLEEILNVQREEANAIINHLWEARMVRKNKGDVQVEPALHELLREVRE